MLSHSSYKTRRPYWFILSCFFGFFSISLGHPQAQSSIVHSGEISDDMWPATPDATPLAKLQDFSKVKMAYV